MNWAFTVGYVPHLGLLDSTSLGMSSRHRPDPTTTGTRADSLRASFATVQVRHVPIHDQRELAEADLFHRPYSVLRTRHRGTLSAAIKFLFSVDLPDPGTRLPLVFGNEKESSPVASSAIFADI